MGAPNVINDIKVIFFIVNTIVGLLAGLLSMSFGVSLAVVIVHRPYDGTVGLSIACIIAGLIILGVAALGYAGAIRQNRVMLFVYAGVMLLAAAVDIWQITNSPIPALTHLGLVMLAIILALFLAVKSCNQRNQGMILSPPPAAYTVAVA